MLVRNTGQQMQVVVDDDRTDRRTGQEHDAGVRQAQQHQHRELALLVMLQTLDVREHFLIHAQSGHYDHGAWRTGVAVHVPEERLEARLQSGKSL
jgi:hypothetical protein